MITQELHINKCSGKSVETAQKAQIEPDRGGADFIEHGDLYVLFDIISCDRS